MAKSLWPKQTGLDPRYRKAAAQVRAGGGVVGQGDEVTPARETDRSHTAKSVLSFPYTYKSSILSELADPIGWYHARKTTDNIH